jgi:hypothetical protein
MLIYWEQSAGGVQKANFDTRGQGKMWNTETTDEEWWK